MRRIISSVCTILMMVSFAGAQQSADVTLTLNEKFFDVLLDAVFTNLQTPAFPIAERQIDSERPVENGFAENASLVFAPRSGFRFLDSELIPGSFNSLSERCDESIRLMREIDNVRTSVRFRDGKINAPIAFSGSYNPPLIGCINFQGWAETTIELEFDKATQTLIGKANVANVRLSGTGGIGSSLIARLVQSSIDKKINPIQILQMEKVSFIVPVQNSGSLKLKATGLRHEIVSGAMNVHITYQFLKG